MKEDDRDINKKWSELEKNNNSTNIWAEKPSHSKRG